MNEIVSFEIAKLLKEVGFDSEYYKYYDSENSSRSPQTFNPPKDISKFGTLPERIYMAPTIASVIDWIFETYGDWISVRREYADGADVELLGYESCIELEDGVNYSDTFKTPTEAYQEGIKTYLYIGA